MLRRLLNSYGTTFDLTQHFVWMDDTELAVDFMEIFPARNYPVRPQISEP